MKTYYLNKNKNAYNVQSVKHKIRTKNIYLFDFVAYFFY